MASARPGTWLNELVKDYHRFLRPNVSVEKLHRANRIICQADADLLKLLQEKE